MECIKCHLTKEPTEFYGKDTACKECRKAANTARYNEKRKDPEFIEAERARHREKYARLNYKEKQKVWDKNRPWKSDPEFNNLPVKLKTPKGVILHHWCYNVGHGRDIVIMDVFAHRRLHVLLELDLGRKVFKVKETGEILDTRKKHLNFILRAGFLFLEYHPNISYTILELQRNCE